MDNHIVVIGATLLDTKGKPQAGLAPGTSNPGFIRSSRGGTARNVAENLARLGAEVILISAVGDDETGARLLEPTAAAGVNVEHVAIVPGHRSGAYLALLDEDGSLSVALDDIKIMDHVTADYLYGNRHLFRNAAMVMIDGNLSPSALSTAVRLAGENDAALCADPSSSRLAFKLRPYLSQLHLLVPNEVEAAELRQVDYPGAYSPDESMELARQFVRAGVETVVVTLADFGLVYATSDETGYIPARYHKMVDSTGAGDAVIAATMYGLANELPAIEAVRLGAAAAGLTLQTSQTVVPDLSLDMLYDHLTV